MLVVGVYHYITVKQKNESAENNSFNLGIFCGESFI